MTRLLSIPFGIVAIAAALLPGAPAAASESSETITVTSRMEASAAPIRAGDSVDVAITLENRTGEPRRVRLDEIVGGVFDDASLTAVARSSSPAVTVTRIGPDRFALDGELPAGGTVTVTYRAAVAAAADRGDGILERVTVTADASRPGCERDGVPTVAEGLGACTAVALPGADLTGGIASGTVITGAVVADARSAAIGVPDDLPATPAVVPPLGMPLPAIAGGAALVVLATAVGAGARRWTRVRRARAASRRPAPTLVRPSVTPSVAPVTTPRRRTGLVSPPSATAATPLAYASRRERRLAESRLALPVA